VCVGNNKTVKVLTPDAEDKTLPRRAETNTLRPLGVQKMPYDLHARLARKSASGMKQNPKGQKTTGDVSGILGPSGTPVPRGKFYGSLFRSSGYTG